MSEIIALVNKYAKAIINLAKANGLSFNLKKANALVIEIYGSINCLDLATSSPVKVNDVIVPFVNETRNLGAIISSTLSWNRQVVNICRRVYAVLQQLKFNKKASTVGLSTHLLSSIILPHFDYCCAVSNNFTDELNLLILLLFLLFLLLTFFPFNSNNLIEQLTHNQYS